MNDRGIELVKSFEKVRLSAHHGEADPDGIFDIGYGHVITGNEVPDLFRPGQTMSQVSITMAQAEDLFKNDIQHFIDGLRFRTTKAALDRLNEDQFSALVSLVYNIGLGAFKTQSTMYKLLLANAPDEELADKGFKGWIHDHTGAIVNGLIVRRAAEKALFTSDYGPLDMFVQNANSLVLGKARKYLGV